MLATSLDFDNSVVAESDAAAIREMVEKSVTYAAHLQAQADTAVACGDAAKDGFYEYVLESGRENRERLKTVAALFLQHGDGLELRHHKNMKWVCLMPDMSEPGRFRYQNYDENGFFSHQSFASRAAALEEVARVGYVIEDNGALVRLEQTATWQRGMEVAAVIMDTNAKRISWTEGDRRVLEINARYAEAAQTAESDDDTHSSKAMQP